ncbi:MAG TPA: metal ABC transporter permease [Thermoplasmata archaeon]|jgi:zinc/manganese transport system permease protein|nr:metal ABC transporter permease [Thermoplasmata archaeon]
MSGGWSGIPWSWNLVTDLRLLWSFEFMRNAMEAGTIIGILAGLVGYFVVLRRSAFAAHALGHSGFSGAAAAVLVGANPVYGLLIFTSVTGSGMAVLGNRASSRDVTIGTLLAFSLALGLLFISLYNGYAQEAYSILFGEVLGISASEVVLTFWTSLAVLAVLALIYRPLLFTSLDEDVAEAKGLPLALLNLVFMILLAVVISFAVQIIGVLLIFALMVTPAAIAVRLTSRSLTAALVSVLVAVSAVWAGLFVALWTNYPASFFIVGIIFVEYILVRGIGALRETALLQGVEAPERDGVRSLRNASLAATASQVLFVGGAALLVAALLAYPAATGNVTLLYRHALGAILALAAAAALGAASSLVYFSGFRKMSTSSRAFTTPAYFTLVGLLGLAFAVGGLVLYLTGVTLATSAYGLAPVAELFGAPLVFLGASFSLVGFVGQAVGSWRMGIRYNDGALRAGAVLMVVPLVGYGVSYIGYRRALARGTTAPPLVDSG